MGLALVRTKLKWQRVRLSFVKLTWATVILLMLMTMPTNLALIVNDLLLHRHLDEFPTYISLDIMEAIDWLETHTETEDVVLASYISSNMLPGRSGNKVFAGDWTYTPNAEEKRQQIKWFFQEASDDDQRYAFLKENGIHYLFSSSFEEDEMGPFKFDDANYLQLRYQNSSVAIYEVIGDGIGNH